MQFGFETSTIGMGPILPRPARRPWNANIERRGEGALEREEEFVLDDAAARDRFDDDDDGPTLTSTDSDL